MSLRQMEYLMAVVEEASFTHAAELLGVTQSALSHQIKALEREVGGPLLERLPRGVRLTPMGRAFLPHAEFAVRSARQARRAARAAAGAAGGELHIATLHAFAIGVLPEVFARWRRDHEQVRLVVHEYATGGELREGMERGVADVALGHRPEGWRGPVVTVGEEEIVVVVAPDDPLSGREAVRLADLADRDWVRCALEPVVEGRRFLDVACERVGFTPRTGVDTEHTSTAVRMAAAGAGVLITAAHVATQYDCAVLPLDPPWARELTAFSRVELTGAAASFVGLLDQRWWGRGEQRERRGQGEQGRKRQGRPAAHEGEGGGRPAG
ncbi:LysR family transcriptional regulator [Streptomyces sparsogenes]|uniref:LysR family transcriptional regulator n=1 Tax=Streptomyces sparsogenes DSM 40356 TaxID=1331668 RepID=A0A1R1SRX9_9ACTN|nr:LysR family transcriptional regulator [Streptomyces sparsogenes]OMI40977.1 LysR family transcriptional regulator [Streptomyces sparsogenes DSM 40356]